MILNNRKITRKNLLMYAFSAISAGISGSLFISCSDAGPNKNSSTASVISGGNCTTNGTQVSISGNHGHVLTISIADINAQVNKAYDITGTADHSHLVTLTAANFAALAGNIGVQAASTSGGGHTHDAVIVCL